MSIRERNIIRDRLQPGDIVLYDGFQVEGERWRVVELEDDHRFLGFGPLDVEEEDLVVRRLQFTNVEEIVPRDDPGGVEDAPSTEPRPPASLPKYVVEAVERQGADRLRDLADWAEERAAFLEAEAREQLEEPPAEGEVDDVEEDVDGDDLDEVPDGVSVNVYKMKVPCGPGCDGCPHGPYRYAKWREGDKVRTKYLGK
ncbi:hypothetical protein C499_19530 [Halogeometricum borinquense DSM 11551]|uniref:DUF6788 domain-containing protein n=1 Tax=Halogeometricum borinquense (strain ATCC 700274 / DSM 11551 / JCM 10706 / KCTC 4070 / PR3) TaxID=469382 RepID=L9UEJ0_HALBP|nr:hypothetical protein [Halogeometricum borinquense]ELY23046.1 hypothetical protein C499_19530 [Halogeometricum borinquense DSM 11551]